MNIRQALTLSPIIGEAIQPREPLPPERREAALARANRALLAAYETDVVGDLDYMSDLITDLLHLMEATVTADDDSIVVEDLLTSAWTNFDAERLVTTPSVVTFDALGVWVESAEVKGPMWMDFAPDFIRLLLNVTSINIDAIAFRVRGARCSKCNGRVRDKGNGIWVDETDGDCCNEDNNPHDGNGVTL